MAKNPSGQAAAYSEIALVADEHDGHVGVGVLPSILQPAGQVVECLPPVMQKQGTETFTTLPNVMPYEKNSCNVERTPCVWAVDDQLPGLIPHKFSGLFQSVFSNSMHAHSTWPRPRLAGGGTNTEHRAHG